MAYRPRPAWSRIRDKAYPSEIASQRPFLAPRIHCEEPWEEFDAEETLRGGGRRRAIMPPSNEEYEPLENMCERFNHALRSGHGFRNEGEE